MAAILRSLCALIVSPAGFIAFGLVADDVSARQRIGARVTVAILVVAAIIRWCGALVDPPAIVVAFGLAARVAPARQRWLARTAPVMLAAVVAPIVIPIVAVGVVATHLSL